MGKYFLLIGYVSVLFALQGSVTAFGQSVSNKSDRKNKIHFKIITKEYFEGTFLLGIVIKPEFLNREDMIFLAEKIKAVYPNENKISVAFFTSKDAAKNISLNEHAKDYQKNMEAWRATYRLDRTTGEEYLSFAPIGRKFNDREEIDLSKSN